MTKKIHTPGTRKNIYNTYAKITQKNIKYSSIKYKIDQRPLRSILILAQQKYF